MSVCLSMCVSLCLCVCKLTLISEVESQTFHLNVAWITSRVKNIHLGHPHSSEDRSIMRQGEAKLPKLRWWASQRQTIYIKTHFTISSPPQCWFQAVVCIRTSRIYLGSEYFLVKDFSKNQNKLSLTCCWLVVLSNTHSVF